MKTLKKFTTLMIICLISTFSFGNVSLFVCSPNQVKAGDIYKVNITINKNDIKGFSKFETILPKGFKIEPIELNGASFYMKDDVAKFIWIQLPEVETINIQYNIMVPKYHKGIEKITGSFHYILHKKKFHQDFNSILTVTNNNIHKGLVFEVQLAAFHKKSELFSNIRIKEKFENGLYKYSVGKFYYIQYALKYREICGVKGAFVVAYYKNEKITIKEALKILNR